MLLIDAGIATISDMETLRKRVAYKNRTQILRRLKWEVEELCGRRLQRHRMLRQGEAVDRERHATAGASRCAATVSSKVLAVVRSNVTGSSPTVRSNDLTAVEDIGARYCGSYLSFSAHFGGARIPRWCSDVPIPCEGERSQPLVNRFCAGVAERFKKRKDLCSISREIRSTLFRFP